MRRRPAGRRCAWRRPGGAGRLPLPGIRPPGRAGARRSRSSGREVAVELALGADEGRRRIEAHQHMQPVGRQQLLQAASRLAGSRTKFSTGSSGRAQALSSSISAAELGQHRFAGVDHEEGGVDLQQGAQHLRLLLEHAVRLRAAQELRGCARAASAALSRPSMCSRSATAILQPRRVEEAHGGRAVDPQVDRLDMARGAGALGHLAEVRRAASACAAARSCRHWHGRPRRCGSAPSCRSRRQHGLRGVDGAERVEAGVRQPGLPARASRAGVVRRAEQPQPAFAAQGHHLAQEALGAAVRAGGRPAADQQRGAGGCAPACRAVARRSAALPSMRSSARPAPSSAAGGQSGSGGSSNPIATRVVGGVAGRRVRRPCRGRSGLDRRRRSGAGPGRRNAPAAAGNRARTGRVAAPSCAAPRPRRSAAPAPAAAAVRRPRCSP